MMLEKRHFEHHAFIGFFEGDRSREYVRNRVESATAFNLASETDFNTGGFTTNLDESKRSERTSDC